MRLDQTRFASHESIFFWVGVSVSNRRGLSFHELGNTCRLTITRPDGTEKIERVGRPMDGLPDSGWLGGYTLRELSQIGRYTEVFEFAGQQTPPAFFTVEDVPILEQITAALSFPSSLIVGPSGGSVTLAVHNGSGQTIRFPRRGEIYSLLWMSFKKTDGQYTSSAPYPERLLSTAGRLGSPHISSDRSFTWDFLQKVRPITVGPGEDDTLQFPGLARLSRRVRCPPDNTRSGSRPRWSSLSERRAVSGRNCALRISVDSSATGLYGDPQHLWVQPLAGKPTHSSRTSPTTVRSRITPRRTTASAIACTVTADDMALSKGLSR
jgi:hypothetical protein